MFEICSDSSGLSYKNYCKSSAGEVLVFAKSVLSIMGLNMAAMCRRPERYQTSYGFSLSWLRNSSSVQVCLLTKASSDRSWFLAGMRQGEKLLKILPVKQRSVAVSCFITEIVCRRKNGSLISDFQKKRFFLRQPIPLYSRQFARKITFTSPLASLGYVKIV
jgi:hypothetical protein